MQDVTQFGAFGVRERCNRGYYSNGWSIFDIFTELQCPKINSELGDWQVKKQMWQRECTSFRQTYKTKSCSPTGAGRRIAFRRIARKRRATFERIFHHLFRNKGRAVAYKLITIKVNRNARVTSCKEQRHWTIEQWEKDLRNNESRFTLYCSDDRVWVFCLPENTSCQNILGQLWN